MTQEIVACARGWIGTRFHHQGRVKKTAQHRGGVDCLGLLIGVAKELNIKDRHGCNLADADEKNYPHYPDTQNLRKKLEHYLEAKGNRSIFPGDVVLLNVDANPQHLAIVSDFQGMLGLIHAYAPAKQVVEHGLDSWWQRHVEAVFSVEA